MATLKSAHKRLAVKRLAVFDRPSDVRDELRDEFGVEVDLSQLAHYDPTTEKGSGLAEDLETLFWDIREQFLEDFTESAIQHKAVRLRILQQTLYDLKDMGHHFGVMDALEQAAKEMGGAYTNRQKLDHSGDISLHESEDFQQVLEVLMDTLEEHPDARADVANALAQVGSDE